MVNKNVYEVHFVGQDYQPISNAVRSMKIMRDGEEYIITSDANILLKDNNNKQSDQKIAREIINRFLNDIAPNGYCTNDTIFINSSQGKSKKLYDEYFGPVDNKGYFCGVVGVIRKSIRFCINDEDEDKLLHVTLQIKSRLDVDENKKISKPFFLSTMLLTDKVKLSNNTIPSNEDEIFDYLLLFWFKEQLKKARLKGYYKTYRRFDNNDDRVKGTIDIARHIRTNMGQKNGRIAYTYRENTINNYLNQLIVAAYYHLKNKYYDLVMDNFDSNNDLKNVINYLSNETEFSSANVKSILKNNLKAISHPYFTEYEDLRLICLRILRDEGISIFDGESGNDTQGILFYLPELWEKFLYNKLIIKALPEGIKAEPQYQILNFGYKKENESSFSYEQLTYPDYVFLDKEKPFMILDAKCKPKWEDAAKGGSVSDVMEDYNKCIRDMVAANSHATGVIFPTNHSYEKDELDRTLCHRISKFNNSDFFYTIPVVVPYVEEETLYSVWNNEFEGIIQEEIDIIKKIVQNEVEFVKNNVEVFEKIKR